MRIKTLVTAVALATMAGMGSVANAAIDTGSPGQPLGSEMFVTVFDPSGLTSYALDLGIFHSTFVDANTTNLSFDLAQDVNFSQFVGQTDLRFTVESVARNFDTLEDVPYFGLLTTTSTSEATLLNQVANFAALAARTATVSTMGLNLNVDAGQGQTDFAANNSGVSIVGDIGYYGNPTWGDNMGNAGFTISSTVGTSIDFYFLSINATDGAYDNVMLTNFGSWNLSTAGMLTYTSNASVIPVPAAAWLFGSGLLGLVGVARRKVA